MTIEPNGIAPYAPVKSVLDVIERYRNRGLRSPFNLELIAQVGVPDGNVSRTLQALKLLDLVDESGEPTTALEELKRASEEEYRGRFEQILRSAYHNVFAVVDPAEDNAIAVRDAFRFYKPDSQQGRMVTLFLGLCEEAGIIAKGPKKRGRTQKARTDGAAPTRRRITPPPPPPPPPTNDLARDPAITGVLARLPASQRWTEGERARWFRAIEGAVDLLIEVESDRAGGAIEKG